ncbi:LETM1-related biofilm-associated protein [Marixanthomonas ophiurae]|uniref:Letm1 RBD domain-containing protein n=1 Tax=Marixanthomonas ophiurae TaxID=387659 RepID=A0A3E1QDB7_9FLAO|nr:LETM1-related biofilm-associated protein [Marixanthomonas ophiurae]RFN60135.1 hypothetical protein DZ858_08860 [Marixanthomonas ophiurae]
MNPSASGWISKFIYIFSSEENKMHFTSSEVFYDTLKKSGFIYGIPVKSLSPEPLTYLTLTKEEYGKVNLLHSLLHIYSVEKSSTNYNEAVNAIISFYKQLDKQKKGWLKRFSISSSETATLEKIMDSRLQENTFLSKKDAASLLTYALLFIDVLCFKKYLKEPDTIKEEAQNLEKNLISSCLLALKSKRKKSKYDSLLLELFESSSEYLEEKTTDSEEKTFKSFSFFLDKDFLTKKYLLDLCCLAVWDDGEVDTTEFQFLQQLASQLQFTGEDVQKSLDDLRNFSAAHAKKIQLFEYEHPVKHLYRQSSATVKLLILRNKKRLQQELEESGELVVLLGKSTTRDLSVEEKQKVKTQLLDICKTIPSLTVFLLPGGTILLPLLIKFIPKLLPSSFNDNRIDGS